MRDVETRFAAVSRSKTFRNLRRRFDLGRKKVLDVGCSYGEHLVHFGPGSAGLTLVPAEVEEGKKRGLDVRYGHVEKPGFSLPERFDVVWANNLFEHMLSPHQFLHTAASLLAPGGVLILGVPVIPPLRFVTRLPRFRGALASSHVNFFTGRTLRETVARAGFRVRECRSFRFASVFLDRLLDPVSPHLYAVAEVSPAPPTCGDSHR